MLIRLFLLFTVIPLLDLALLLVLADRTSWQTTLLLVVVTGVAGAWLAKSQGLRTFRRLRQEMQQGRMPSGPLLDSLFLVAAGALLVTPGVFSDVIAITLLLPWTREFYKRVLLRWARTRFRLEAFVNTQPVPPTPRNSAGDVLEGTFRRTGSNSADDHG